jgi:hypothetical protein
MSRNELDNNSDVISTAEALVNNLLAALMKGGSNTYVATELLVRWSPVLKPILGRPLTYIDVAKVATVLSKYLVKTQKRPAKYAFNRKLALERLEGHKEKGA